MVHWRMALPMIAVGFFVGVLFSNSIQQPPVYGGTMAGAWVRKPVLAHRESMARDVRAELPHNSTPNKEMQPQPFLYKALGPEFSQEPWWEQFHSNRTLYVAPYTGLANTLQAMGSALTIAYHEKINVKFVFHRPWTGPSPWSELFSFPVIDDTVVFPDGESSIQKTTSCKYGQPPFSWSGAHVEWEPHPDGSGEIACVTTCCWREPPFPESILWFYGILRPAKALQQQIDQFKADNDWDKYQWVGVHIRRTDNVDTMKQLLKFYTNVERRNAIDPTSSDTMLPIQNYVDLMQRLKDQWPIHELGFYQAVKPIRFFLATDKDETKSHVINQFVQNQVVSFEKGMNAATMRTEHRGMQLAVIDMFLLASCKVVIGTPFSTFSEAATNIGAALQLEPDFKYTVNQSPK